MTVDRTVVKIHRCVFSHRYSYSIRSAYSRQVMISATSSRRLKSTSSCSLRKTLRERRRGSEIPVPVEIHVGDSGSNVIESRLNGAYRKYQVSNFLSNDSSHCELHLIIRATPSILHSRNLYHLRHHDG